MPKINLLYVITKLELGGAQKQLLSLINNLDKTRYNIFLFTARSGWLIQEAAALDGLFLKKSEFLQRAINPVKDILALIEIYVFIKKNRFQIVHTHSSKAGILGRLAAALAKTPVIIHTVHGWSFNDYQPGIVNHFYGLLEKFCARLTRKIIVVSRSDRDKGLKRSIGRPDQYAVIGYSLDAPSFRDLNRGNESKKLLGIADTALVVGMIACFKPQKAPLDFIELAARVKKNFPQVRFVLVGDGKLRRKIELRIKRLNLEGQVILTGWRKDIPSILSGLDVLVLTSLWEGLPIVVLEAMAAQVPVVATDTGGIREVISNAQNGYLVKPHDISWLQNRLEDLLANPSKRDAFIKQSSQIIGDESFLISSMAQNTDQLYASLVQENPGV